MSTAVDTPKATYLPANDGQNDRHQSKSEKEDKDLEQSETAENPKISTLTTVCSEATAFATNMLRTWDDVEHHARTLAPMLGIYTSSHSKKLKQP